MLSAEICIYSLTSLSSHHQTHSIRWVELLHTFNNFIRWWIWGINSKASSLCLILSLTCLDYIFLKNILLHILIESFLLLRQDAASDLRSKRSLITDTEQNLRSAKGSCDSMATKFQEHCPDIEKQQAEVEKLNKRYNNLNKQLDSRWEGQDKDKSVRQNLWKKHHNKTYHIDLHIRSAQWSLLLCVSGLKACREQRLRTTITAMIMTIWTTGCLVSQTTSPVKLMTRDKWKPSWRIRG